MLHIEAFHDPPTIETRYNWEYMSESYDLQDSINDTTKSNGYDNSFVKNDDHIKEIHSITSHDATLIQRSINEKLFSQKNISDHENLLPHLFPVERKLLQNHNSCDSLTKTVSINEKPSREMYIYYKKINDKQKPCLINRPETKIDTGPDNKQIINLLVKTNGSISMKNKMYKNNVLSCSFTHKNIVNALLPNISVEKNIDDAIEDTFDVHQMNKSCPMTHNSSHHTTHVIHGKYIKNLYTYNTYNLSTKKFNCNHPHARKKMHTKKS